MKQILKNHKISFAARENTIPEPIKIAVENNLAYKSISTTCGCNRVEAEAEFYTIYFERLPLVNWHVTEKTEKFFIKTTRFTIHHIDDLKEAVTINIAVYDPNTL